MRGTLTQRRYQTAVRVRGLEAGDLPEAADLLAGVETPWRRAAGPRLGEAIRESLAAGLGRPSIATLVAERDGRLVGVLRVVCGAPSLPAASSRRVAVVAALVGRRPPGPREAYIEQLAVLASAQRSGVGGALIKAAVAFSAAAEVETVTCWIHRRNHAALHLATHLGLTRQRRGCWNAPIAYALGMRPLTARLADVRPGD